MWSRRVGIGPGEPEDLRLAAFRGADFVGADLSVAFLGALDFLVGVTLADLGDFLVRRGEGSRDADRLVVEAGTS